MAQIVIKSDFYRIVVLIGMDVVLKDFFKIASRQVDHPIFALASAVHEVIEVLGQVFCLFYFEFEHCL